MVNELLIMDNYNDSIIASGHGSALASESDFGNLTDSDQSWLDGLGVDSKNENVGIIQDGTNHKKRNSVVRIFF